MKKPKISRKFNLTYWLWIARNDKLVAEHEKRGNPQQKKDLILAQKYIKWLSIQKQKDAEYFEKLTKKRVRRKKIKKRRRKR